jgi:hypothetical protein
MSYKIATRESLYLAASGLVGENFPRTEMIGTTAITSGQFIATSIVSFPQQVITNVHVVLTLSSPVWATPGFRVALYEGKASGTANLLASSGDLSGSTVTGMNTCALTTPYTVVTHGPLYVGAFFGFSSGTVSLGRGSGTNDKAVSQLVGGFLRPAALSSSLSDLPSPLTVGSASMAPWFGVS